MKPLFFWVSPPIRSMIKAAVLRWVFKKLYGQTALPPQSAKGLRSTSIVEKVSLLNSITSLKTGVNLVGYPLAVIGEGEFIRQTARSFQTTPLKFGLVDCQPKNSAHRLDERYSEYISTDNPFKINIFHLKPGQLESSVVQLGTSFVENRYNIGYWTWELGELPDAWQASIDFLDEVWCPSQFIQSAVSRKSSRSVQYLPMAIDLEPVEGFGREYFSLPSQTFTFLFVFDFKSYVARKNPEACIRAFQKAFPAGNEAVTLVLKSMAGEMYPEAFERLQKEVAKDPRILWIDKSFKPEEMIGLMQAADSFVSLHRSEGIGLGMAQSMLLGKPVIATHYSGNTDFMHQDNSCLVDYELVAVGEDEYPFAKGQVWANPDGEHAAWYMRRLVEDADYRNSIAAAGQSYIRTHHNPAVIGAGYLRRLQELGLV